MQATFHMFETNMDEILHVILVHCNRQVVVDLTETGFTVKYIFI